MEQSLTRSTLRGAAWIGGASVARLGLRVVSAAILARLLTPREYGILAGAFVVMDLAMLIYYMGLAPTLIQRKEIRHDHVATAFCFSLVMAAFASVAVWCAAPIIADLLRIPDLVQILRVFAFLLPFGAFNTLSEALLARNMQGKSVALRPLFSFTIAAFLVAIPMAHAGFGYWSLVAMHAAETIFGAIAFGFAARKLLVWPKPSRQAFRELWPMSLGFSLNQPFIYLAANADRFLVGRWLGVDALGVYTRASFITTQAASAYGDIARVSIFPAMARVQEEPVRLQKGLLSSLSVIALLTLPLSTYCIVFASEIVTTLLGPQWNAAAGPFAVLSTTLYMRLGWRTCYAVLQGLGLPYRLMLVQALGAVAVISGAVLAVPRGLVATCLAVVAANGVIFVLVLALVLRRLNLSWHRVLVTHAAPLAVTVISAMAWLSVDFTFVWAADMVRLAVGVVIFGLVILVGYSYGKLPPVRVGYETQSPGGDTAGT